MNSVKKEEEEDEIQKLYNNINLFKELVYVICFILVILLVELVKIRAFCQKLFKL